MEKKRDRKLYWRQRARLQRIRWLMANPGYKPHVKLTDEELKARRLARHKIWVGKNLEYVRQQARERKKRNRGMAIWLEEAAGGNKCEC